MAGKPQHDWAANSADYLAGLSQADIAAKHGTTKSTVVRAVTRLLPPEAREKRRRQRLFEGASLKTKARQATKIAQGAFRLEHADGLLLAHVQGVTFTFDPDVRDLLERYAWRVSTAGRLFRQERREGRAQNIYVYHDIMGERPTRKHVIDHINRDPTDNRRSNLRVCSYSENALNTARHAERDSAKDQRNYA